MNGDDVCWAMGALGFDEYAGPLTGYLQRYRELEGDRSANQEKANTEEKEDSSSYRNHFNQRNHQDVVVPPPPLLKFDKKRN